MRFFAALLTAAVMLTACHHTTPPAPTTTNPPPVVPSFNHVILVVEENHSSEDLIGSPAAPYINSLAASGAYMTQSFAVAHPSEPNYLALFAGDTMGIMSDVCPLDLDSKPNLGAALWADGKEFVGYAEDLPTVGSPVCAQGEYARKHAPWTNFANVPSQFSQPLTAFPTDYTKLPTVAMVTPNLINDMHDGTVQQGDAWLQTHLDPYARWAQAHNSLLVVTWDESDFDNAIGNHISTIFYGAHIKSGNYNEKITHYSVLATIEEMYGLPKLANSATATPITDIWN